MVNEQELKRAAENTVAGHLLRHLSKRKNDAKTTSVDLVMSLRKSDGAGITRGEAVQALQALEDAGCGKFLSGRRGLKTRLDWAVSAIDTAQKLLGNGASEPLKTPEVGVNRDHDDTYHFRFPLRRGYEVSIELPSDLDADERQRLATAISALPVS